MRLVSSLTGDRINRSADFVVAVASVLLFYCENCTMGVRYVEDD